MNFHLDEHGFLWHHPPSISIAGAVYDQEEHNATRAQKQVERRRFTKGPRQGSHAGEPHDDAATPSPEGGPASKFRRRGERAKVKDAVPSPNSRGRRTPPMKKLKHEKPSLGAQKTKE